MKYQIIYLNGPTSSGKTTLAFALQEEIEEPFLKIGIDSVIELMPNKLNGWKGTSPKLGYYWEKKDKGYTLKQGSFATKIALAFHQMVLKLAQMGFNIIIDDVSFGKEEVDIWKQLLKDYSVLYVGVNAPLEIIEQREHERADRMIGSAIGMYDQVHKNIEYDLMLDTSKHSLKENALMVSSML